MKNINPNHLQGAPGVRVIGASGSGKTKYLEDWASQIIARGRCLLLVDPHGALYEDMLAFSAARPLRAPAKSRRKEPPIRPKRET